MSETTRHFRSDRLSSRLPCGGEIWLDFEEGLFPAGKGHVNVAVFPHVDCPRTYADGKGCPWVERLRKLHAVAKGLEEAVGYGEATPPKAKPYVEERDRVVREIRDDYARGVAFTPGEVLYDRHLRPKCLEEAEDAFRECRQVYSKGNHKRAIIPFLMRLFGKRTGGKAK